MDVGYATGSRQEVRTPMKYRSNSPSLLLAVAVGLASVVGARPAAADLTRAVRLTEHFVPQIAPTTAVPSDRQVVVTQDARAITTVRVRPIEPLPGVGFFVAPETTVLTGYGDPLPDLPYELSAVTEGSSVHVVGIAPSVTVTIRRSANGSVDRLALADGGEIVFADPLQPDLSYHWRSDSGESGSGLFVITAQRTNELTSITRQTIEGEFTPPMLYQWRENNRAVFGSPGAAHIVAFSPDPRNELFEGSDLVPAGAVTFFRATGDPIPSLPYTLSSDTEGGILAESPLGSVQLKRCQDAVFCYGWQTSSSSGAGQLHQVDDVGGTVRIRAGEPTVLTAKFGRNIGADPTYSAVWHSDNGTFLGEGLRVAYVPHVDFVGVAIVRCRLMQGDQVVGERVFTLPVSPARARLVLTSVISEGDEVVVQGRSENLSNPAEFKLAAFFRSDIYYPVPDNHIIPLQADGRFRFTVSPRADANRLVIHLIRNDVDPDDENHCQNPWQRPPVRGVCTGTFDFFYNSKARVPLLLNDTDSLAYVSHRFTPTPTHSDPQLRFLQSRLSEVPVLYPGTPTNNPNILPDAAAPATARLLHSYTHHSQTYLYDVALAILAFTHAGLTEEAKSLLDALQYLQVEGDNDGRDGSWYFSYDLDGRSIYPAAASWNTDGTWDRYDYSDRRVSGAIVWAAMAIAAYRLKYPEDTRYDDMLARVISYMERNLIDVEHAGISSRPMRFQDNDRPSTVWDESRTVSVEHNLDAYAAFRMYSRITADPGYLETAAGIRRFVESMWDEDNGKFYVGYGNQGAGPNTQEVFMDPQSWGLLSMGHDPAFASRYGRGMQWVYEHFFEPIGLVSRTTPAGTEVVGAPGFFDFFPEGGDLLSTPHQFTWTEGTLGVIMAMQLLERSTGEPQTYTQFGASYDANKLLALMNRLQDAEGGLPYATWNSLQQDFSHEASIAGAAWLYFANRGFNPFDPDFSADEVASDYSGPASYRAETPRTSGDASRSVLHFVGESQRIVDDLDDGLVRVTPDRRTTTLSRELGVTTTFHGNFAHRPSFVDMYKVFTRNADDETTGKALRIEYDVTGPGWAGYYTLLGGIDVSDFDVLSFLVKGVSGGESFTIGFTDRTYADFKLDGVYVGSVTQYLPDGIGTQWKRVVVPLDTISEQLDLTDMGAVLFRFDSKRAGSVFVDDIVFQKGAWKLVPEDVSFAELGHDRIVSLDEKFEVEDRLQPGDFGGFAYRLTESAPASSVIMEEIETEHGVAYQIEYTKQDHEHSVAGMYVGVPRDLREYNAVELFVRGDRDGVAFDVGLLDIVADNRQDGVFGGSIYRYLAGGVTTEWQRVRIPLRDFPGLDFGRMVSLAFDFSTPGSGVVYLREPRFYYDEELASVADTEGLLVDDFNFSDNNRLGGLAGAYSGLPSLCRVSRVAADDLLPGDRALRIDYSRASEGWCGYFSRLDRVGAGPQRLARYNAITFLARGEAGGERFEIAIADQELQARDVSLLVGDINDYLPQGLSQRWQKVVVPLNPLLHAEALDMARMGTVSFHFAIPGIGTIYIDDLRFERIPDIVVDDFSLDSVNSLGYVAGTFQRAPSSVSATRVVDGEESVLRIEYDRQDQGWCGYFSRLNPTDGGYLDVTRSNLLSFRIRGEQGSESFHLKLADAALQKAEASRSLGTIDEFLPGGVTTEWQRVVVPLPASTDALQLSELGTFVIEFVERARGVVFIDDLVFATDPQR